MNITFIIGNGFDINLGMKTRYSDFYDYYISNANENKLTKELEKDKINEYKNWSDFELEVGKFSERFDISTKDEYLNIINDFKDLLESYLKMQEDNFKILNDYARLNMDFINFMGNFAGQLSPKSEKDINDVIKTGLIFSNREININFITFNYTNILEKLFKGLGKIEVKLAEVNCNVTFNKIIHIHGMIGENILIGVNDNNQIANDLFKKDEEVKYSVIKPQVNEGLENLIKEESTEIIDKSDILCLYGTSIGETDKSWWKYINKSLIKNESQQLIIFGYEKDFNNLRYNIKIIRKNNLKKFFTNFIVDNYEEDGLILDFFEDEQTMKSLENRIHIAFNVDIFNVDKEANEYVKEEYLLEV